jgi:Concanavalin A-like lectin/glucanases superfamily
MMRLLLLSLLFTGLHGQAQNSSLVKDLLATPGLIATWDFKEPAGQARLSLTHHPFPLKENNGMVARIKEGPLSGYSAQFGEGAFLSIPHAATGALNVYGKNRSVTVLAWVKWTGRQTGFIGGMWNEYQDGGKRQYGLFVSLPYYNGNNQVCGHVSSTGKPTPPFPYSIDYSASKQEVPLNEWACIAFTYDGTYIRSYLNGVFEPRDTELVNHTKGFEGFPDGLQQSKNPYLFTGGMGNNGSDFTVGAVLLKAGMGNFFKGQLGGLAVFDRALTEMELKKLCSR